MKTQVARKTPKGERLECPACGKSSMILHRKTLLVSMIYVCPETGCGAKIETTPPRDPPKQPTSPPTGGTSPTLFTLSSGLIQQIAKAA